MTACPVAADRLPGLSLPDHQGRPTPLSEMAAPTPCDAGEGPGAPTAGPGCGLDP